MGKQVNMDLEDVLFLLQYLPAVNSTSDPHRAMAILSQVHLASTNQKAFSVLEDPTFTLNGKMVQAAVVAQEGEATLVKFIGDPQHMVVGDTLKATYTVNGGTKPAAKGEDGFEPVWWRGVHTSIGPHPLESPSNEPMYQHENTVGLVKLVRNIYGLSLKEALDSVRNGTWLKYYGEIADLQKKSKAAGVGIIVVSKPNPPEYDLPINLQAH